MRPAAIHVGQTQTGRSVLDILHYIPRLGGMKTAHSRQRPGNPTLAVAILRTSTEDQNLGPQAQRATIERWAASKGVTVTGWHEDRVSGATPPEDRPGLMAALAAIREHRAGLLVAARRDRIARDVVVAATVERLAQDAGARVVTSDGVTVEDTPEGQLMRGLMDLFSQYERQLIRARTKAALAVKRARSERVSGRAPLGFRFEEGRLVPDPGESVVLARVLDMRAKGLSLARVTAILNSEGVRCRGGCWHVTTLARALRRAA